MPRNSTLKLRALGMSLLMLVASTAVAGVSKSSAEGKAHNSRLSNIIYSDLHQRNLTLTKGAKTRLDRLIRAGEETLEADTLDTKWVTAERNAEKLTDAIAELAQGREVTEKTVVDASIKICPLYPFC